MAKESSKKSKTSDRVLSVDFGSHTLKLVEIELGPLGPVIRTFGVSPYTVDKEGGADLVGTLEKLMRQTHTSTLDVALVLPETDTTVFRFDEVATRMLERLKPSFAASNIVWTTADMLIALPKVVYNFYSDVIKTAGLNLVAIQHVPTSLAKSVANMGRAAVLETGAESSNWYVFDDGYLMQRSTLPYGGEALTKSLSVAHEWDRQKAENHKRTLAGEPSTWPETSALVVQNFLDRWWKDLTGYLAEQPSHLDNILITGGGSRFLPMREYIFNLFGIMPEEWRLPAEAHISEELRPHLEPQVPLLANTLAHLVYS